MDLGFCGRQLVLQLVDPGLCLGQRGRAGPPGSPRSTDSLDEDTTTPLAMASSTAPDTTNRAPYSAVSRIRTVRAAARPPAAFSFLASPLVCLPRQAAAPGGTAIPASRMPGRA